MKLKRGLFYFGIMICCIYAKSQPANSTWKMTVQDFSDSIAKKRPLITGGCAIITNGAIAVSLEIMALEISGGKLASGLPKDSIAACINYFFQKRDSLEWYAQNDLIIFNQVRSVPAAQRDSAFYQALIQATISPIKAARCIIELSSKLSPVINNCYKTVLSDLDAGNYLLDGAVRALLALAKSNIDSLKQVDRDIFNIQYKWILDYNTRSVDEISKKLLLKENKLN